MPLAIDLYCGLGGWTEALLDEGWDVIGFDIERHEYGDERYPAQMVIQDVRTLHGSQLRAADLIVASPPCQKYSYMAMPWTRAKDLARWYRDPVHPERIRELNELFDACFRIQREACAAAGRHIPLIVENVRGAQPWVGRARWNYGSYYLWGDVPALMPVTVKGVKQGGNWFHDSSPGTLRSYSGSPAYKSTGMNWSDRSRRGQDFTRVAGAQAVKATKDGLGGYGGGFGWDGSPMRRGNSKSPTRKAASALIAKIPYDLARHIAATFNPVAERRGAPDIL